MKKVSVEFENCYGIRAFKHEFDFTNDVKGCMIYAPNGSMKSSFARTMKDISLGESPKDLAYPERVSKWSVKDTETQAEIVADSIFVVASHVSGSEPQKMSLLLATEGLRSKYDKIYADVREKKEELISALQGLSGLKKDCESILAESYKGDSIAALFSMQAEVEAYEEEGLGLVKYSDIINDKTEALFADVGFIQKLEEYIETYENLVSQSALFQRGVFDHNNADEVSKGLAKNKFFNAGHTVSLKTLTGKVEVATLEELEDQIVKEKETILKDEALRKKFIELDKKIAKNEGVKRLREVLNENPFLTAKLANLPSLKRSFWLAYLKANEVIYTAFLGFYVKSKDEIDGIIKEAKTEQTKWLAVVDEFEARFHLPFKISVGNQEDVILKQQAPVLKFTFCDDAGQPIDIRKDSLLGLSNDNSDGILSTGERRALYILNMIFEVEARRLSGQPTLMIVDDIADSFDYKNKYAIVEYLDDICGYDNFGVIILTHNFDFFRTCMKRIAIPSPCCRYAEKSISGIQLVPEVYRDQVPLSVWRSKFDVPLNRIAAIPFIRNIIEYCDVNHGDNVDWKLLTACLHIKPTSKNITLGDVKKVFGNVLRLEPANTIDFKTDDTTKVIEEIFACAAGVSHSHTTTPVTKLEEKLVLSMAIRLHAEELMIKRIKAHTPTFQFENLAGVQTAKLLKNMKKMYPNQLADEFKVLKRVSIMTPENIHVNSFMYEPIIDLGGDHLVQLYMDISKLNANCT